jgi:hypothetical protein
MNSLASPRCFARVTSTSSAQVLLLHASLRHPERGFFGLLSLKRPLQKATVSGTGYVDIEANVTVFSFFESAQSRIANIAGVKACHNSN